MRDKNPDRWLQDTCTATEWKDFQLLDSKEINMGDNVHLYIMLTLIL